MSDITLAVLVTRSELGLPPLNINDPTAINPAGDGYRIIRDSFGPGQFMWRRTTATSPFVEGSATVHAVREQVTAPIGVRCLAQSPAALTHVTSQLILAFSQFRYMITVTMGDTPWGGWLCEPADYSVGGDGKYQPFHFRQSQQELYFQVPRYPTTQSGSM